jgi:hypothetical protein
MQFIALDVTGLAVELRGGLMQVVGSDKPTAEEKCECVDEVSRYAMDGWCIAADLNTTIGRLAALTAQHVGGPFVPIRVTSQRSGTTPGGVTGQPSDTRPQEVP